jgi:hypothetical protein
MKTYYNENRKITVDLKAARSAVNSGRACWTILAPANLKPAEPGRFTMSGLRKAWMAPAKPVNPLAERIKCQADILMGLPTIDTDARSLIVEALGRLASEVEATGATDAETHRDRQAALVAEQEAEIEDMEFRAIQYEQDSKIEGGVWY